MDHSSQVHSSAPDLPPTGAKTMIEAVLVQIREDILAGHYPPGSRLRVEHLRKHFNVGASTIREALSRLMSESLVTTEGQRGFRVAEISLKDFHDIAEMRKLLEITAMRKSLETGDDEWEANIVSAFHRLAKAEQRLSGNSQSESEETQQDWSRLNKRFHDALVAACGNRWLLDFRRMLHDQSERYIRLSLRTRSEPRDVHAEHEAIYNAVLERDAEQASVLLAHHIDRTVEVVTASFRKNYGTLKH